MCEKLQTIFFATNIKQYSSDFLKQYFKLTINNLKLFVEVQREFLNEFFLNSSLR